MGSGTPNVVNLDYLVYEITLNFVGKEKCGKGREPPGAHRYIYKADDVHTTVRSDLTCAI